MPTSALRHLLPEELILPAYGRDSLLELPASIGRLLGVEEGWAGPPLGPQHQLERYADIDRVILLLLDGIGWNRLQQQLERDDVGLPALLERFDGGMSQLTSVVPSTTSVATTTLLGNGAAPAETGMLGYTVRLPRLGLVGNLLFWRPEGKRVPRNGELEAFGVVPETFVPTPSLFQVLAERGVGGSAFLPNHIAGRSPLSRLQLRGAAVRGYVNFTDCLSQLDSWLADTAGRPGFAYAYLPDFDTLSHRDGPQAAAWPALFGAVIGQLAAWLQRGGAARQRTLLLVTADHGHAATPPAERRTYRQLPALARLSVAAPAGEPRHRYFYAWHGAKDELLGAAREALGEAFVVLDGLEALHAGLYGDPARLHPEAERRVGDVVALARGGASLWDPADEGILLGMHGALDADEMLVPLLRFRLDAG